MIAARPLDLGAVLHVAERMRDSDRAEIFALMWPGADTPSHLAMEVIRVTRWGATIHTDDDEPQVAVGLAPLRPGVCSAWMFATDRWSEAWRATARYVSRMLIPAATEAGVYRLEVHVAADNQPAIDFLRWCGFAPEGWPVPFGRAREEFIPMARITG